MFRAFSGQASVSCQEKQRFVHLVIDPHLREVPPAIWVERRKPASSAGRASRNEYKKLRMKQGSHLERYEAERRERDCRDQYHQEQGLTHLPRPHGFLLGR